MKTNFFKKIKNKIMKTEDFIGKDVKIIAKTCGHQYCIGSIVKIISKHQTVINILQ